MGFGLILMFQLLHTAFSVRIHPRELEHVDLIHKHRISFVYVRREMSPPIVKVYFKADMDILGFIISKMCITLEFVLC